MGQAYCSFPSTELRHAVIVRCASIPDINKGNHVLLACAELSMEVNRHEHEDHPIGVMIEQYNASGL